MAFPFSTTAVFMEPPRRHQPDNQHRRERRDRQGLRRRRRSPPASQRPPAQTQASVRRHARTRHARKASDDVTGSPSQRMTRLAAQTPLVFEHQEARVEAQLNDGARHLAEHREQTLAQVIPPKAVLAALWEHSLEPRSPAPAKPTPSFADCSTLTLSLGARATCCGRSFTTTEAPTDGMKRWQGACDGLRRRHPQRG